MMTSEYDSYTGSVVMQYNTSNCLAQQSWIRFRNTHDIVWSFVITLS